MTARIDADPNDAPDAGGTVQYGTPGSASGLFQNARISTLAFVDVVAGLRREIEAAGFWVLHEIDPQRLLQQGGHSIGAARQILFFHPDLMVRLLQADPAALLEAPLKFAVMDRFDGTVAIRWNDPAAAFARYANPLLTKLGQELASACNEIYLCINPG